MPSRTESASFYLYWFAAFCLIAIAGIWAIAADRIILDRRDALAHAQSDSQLLDRIYAEHATSTVQQIDRTSRFLKRDFEKLSFMPTSSELFSLAQAGLPDAVESVSVVDAQGNLTASSGKFRLNNIAERDYFNAVQSSSDDHLYFSVPARDPETNRWTMQFSRRLNRPNGDFAGILLISVDPAVFSEFFDAGMGQEGVVALVRDDGSLIVRRVGQAISYEDEDGHPFVKMPHASGVNGLDPVLRQIDLTERAYTLRHLDGYPIAAIVGVTYDRGLAVATQRAWTYIEFAAGITMLTVAFFIWLALRSRELRKSRAATQTAEATYRAAVDGSLDSFYILEALRDDDGRITDFICRDVNQRGADMLGLTRAQCIGIRICETFPAYREAEYFGTYVRAVEMREIIEEEIEVRHPLIRAHWLHRQIVPVDDRIALTSRDISARKRTDMEIRESRAFFRLLVENLPLIVYVKSLRRDTEGQLVMWNHVAEIATGYTAGQVLGRTLAQTFPPKVAREWEAKDRKLLASPMVVDSPEIPFQRADGKLRWLHNISVPILDESGNPEYILGISEDITARRSQEQTLRAKQAELAAVHDASPLGLFRADSEGHVTYVNYAFTVITDLTEEEALRGRWKRAIHPSDRDRILTLLEESFNKGKSFTDTFRFQWRDGKIVWVSLRGVTIVVDGQIGGFVGTIDDITERRELSRAREMLAAIFEGTTDIVATTDATGQLTYLNLAGRRAWRVPVDYDASRIHLAEHHPAWVMQTLAEVSMPQALRHGTWFGETAYIDAGGQEVPLDHLVIAHKDAAGHLEYYSSIMRDITAAKQAALALQRSEAHLRTITDTLPMLVSYVDARERFGFVNKAYETAYRRSREEIIGLTVRELYGRNDYERDAPQIRQALQGETVIFENELRDAGRYVCWQVTYIPQFEIQGGEVIGFHMIIQDITAVKLSEQRLRLRAELDPLTNLVNRAGFETRLADAMDRSHSAGHIVALLYIDVDFFKIVNDTRGHVVGDMLLKAVAERLLRCCRAGDVVARLGGDEFAMITGQLPRSDDAERIARKIVQTMHDPFSLDGESVKISVSIGVALYRGDQRAARDLVRSADEMLYQAKGGGRNRFCIAGLSSTTE